MTTLRVEQLTVAYGQVPAVDGVDFSVSGGEVMVLLGANGAGKTSTLRGVMGLERTTGQVHLDDRALSRMPTYRRARQGLVLVPEGRRVFAPLTIEENLLLGGYARRYARASSETLDRIYEMFPILANRRNSQAGLLSGGEQQMLAYGRALMSGPEIVLMDEPSMGLAPTVVDQVMETASRIARSGIGVLMVEQNVVTALEFATRAAVLDRGRLTADGPAADLRSHPSVLRAFLGSQAVEPEEDAS